MTSPLDLTPAQSRALLLLIGEVADHDDVMVSLFANSSERRAAYNAVCKIREYLRPGAGKRPNEEPEMKPLTLYAALNHLIQHFDREAEYKRAKHAEKYRQMANAARRTIYNLVAVRGSANI